MTTYFQKFVAHAFSPAVCGLFNTFKRTMPPNRFVFLDGIRGMAAAFVVTRHILFWNMPLFRSYLAVDIFFLLSGFVIAAAYERKLLEKQITPKEFILIRLIRLHPVFLISIALSALLATTAALAHNSQQFASLSQILTSTVMSFFYLPSLAKGPDLYPLNVVYRSLGFEIVINILYAIFHRTLSSPVLAVVMATNAVILIFFAFRHGNINYGYSWGAVSIAMGFARAAFGIASGILLRRNSKTEKGFLPPSWGWASMLVVAIILCSASMGDSLDATIDLICVFLIFPAVVHFSSKSSPPKAAAFLVAIGAASYPLYLLHAPLGRLVSFFLHGNKSTYIGVAFIATLMVVCWLIETKLDDPIRKRLALRFLKPLKKIPSPISRSETRY